jgi:hypothetical protein
VGRERERGTTYHKLSVVTAIVPPTFNASQHAVKNSVVNKCAASLACVLLLCCGGSGWFTWRIRQ